MKYLLDTHVLLWTLIGDKRLPADIKNIIFDANNQIYYSTASSFEIELKHLKRKDFKLNAEQFCFLCDQNNVINLPIKNEHIYQLSKLKKNNNKIEHNDLFDKLLLSQAIEENMYFITHDNKFEIYDEKNIVLF